MTATHWAHSDRRRRGGGARGSTPSWSCSRNSTSTSAGPAGRASTPTIRRREPSRRSPRRRRRSAEIRAAAPVDDVDRVTKMDLTRELELTIEQARGRVRAARPQRDRLPGAGPAGGLRSGADRDRGGLGQHRASACTTCRPRWTDTSRRCARASQRGNVPAIRQVREVITQAEKQVADTGFFFQLRRGRRTPSDGDLPDSLTATWPTARSRPRPPTRASVSFLGDELAQHAPEKDAVGRELYALASRDFLGATHRPGRNLRVGHRGTGPDGRRSRRPSPARSSRAHPCGGDRLPRRRPDSQAARHGRAAAVDAGRPATGRSRSCRRPTSTSRTRSSGWSA